MSPRPPLRVLLVALAPLTACILTIGPLPDEDRIADAGPTLDGGRTGTGSGDGSVADAVTGDAETSTDAGGEPAGPSWVDNGGFEAAPSGAFGCGLPWGWFQAALATDSTAHGGLQACRVCAAPPTAGSAYALNYDPSGGLTPVDAGTPLVARAWVRAPPGITTGQQVSTSIRIYGDGGAVVDRCDGTPRTIGQSYVALECRFTTAAAGGVNVYIHSDAPPAANECFLVDDVTLTLP